MKRDYITTQDYTKEELMDIINLSLIIKKNIKAGYPLNVLYHKTLGMIFEQASTRTRVSFEVGMYQLGGYPLFLSSNDIQLGRGETIYDTANVLSRFLDGIMIRTYAHSDVEDLAKYGTIPIINGDSILKTDTIQPAIAPKSSNFHTAISKTPISRIFHQ